MNKQKYTKDDLIGNFIKSNYSDIMWMPLEFTNKIYNENMIEGYKFIYVKDLRHFGRISWAILETTLNTLNSGEYKFIRLDGKE